MTLEGAVIREQGVSFAILIVKSHILNDSSSTRDAIDSFAPYFPGLPVVLMAQDARGVPTYSGRRDLVNFLSQISISRIPWKRFSF